MLRPLFPEHHLSPALSPISWRRGRRTAVDCLKTSQHVDGFYRADACPTVALGFVFEALFGEAEALVVIVFAAEAGEFAGDFAKTIPAFVHVIEAFEEAEVSAQFRGDEGAELFGDFGGIAGGVEFGDIFELGPEAIAAVFVVEPFFIAAVAPFVEVVVINGAAAEFLGEHLVALGQFVDPLKNIRAGLAVQEAAVELFADVVWQAGYFSYAAHFSFPFSFSSCTREWHAGWDKGCLRGSKIRGPKSEIRKKSEGAKAALTADCAD
jgi:hypothetical protein